MRHDVRVENPRPVPLRPLREVLDDGVPLGFTSNILYVEDVDNTEFVRGWCVAGADTLIFGLDGEWSWLDEIDKDRAMARWLQPGERLSVVYEA